ncbi:apolipoprotein N-acyltransferase [Pseudaestuariivita sp.]|uniref:apolipoprotein N-acyltransferase n=1 Tax=Pseudaestuariivita sp. TaxID=2211669 RepID=UPI004059F7A2
MNTTRDPSEPQPSSRPWRAGLGYAALGGLAALGQAPFDLWPLAFAAFAALFYALPLEDARGAGWRLWAFGFGYFLVALHWVFEPFLVDPVRHGWMAPFAVGLLAGGLALFWAIAGWLTVRMRGGAVLLALLWALAELARGHVFTGFPWAMPGYIWVETPVRHLAAYIGPYGLTAWTVLMAAAVGVVLRQRSVLASVACAGGASLMLATLLVSTAPGPLPGAPTVRLVQPNVPQREKWDPAHIQRHFDRYIALSAEPPEGALDLILWPETALPLLLNHADVAFEIMAEAVPDVPFVLGIQRRSRDDLYYNAAVLVDGQEVTQTYDKHHLVPFGEYMPGGALTEALGLRALAQMAGDFSAGPGPSLMELAGLSALPLICYEVVFPANLRGTARPNVLVQLTNDAWFGKFSGPYQHLAQARMRSVEQGLPMLRVANTGVSAVIDARGAVARSLPLGEAGVLDVKVPAALPPTLYARLGDWPVALLLLLAALGVAARTRYALT